ncbi:MAG: fibronectin type III domain-containing protein [Chitinophagales bacterium]|nr:fibronectin type III domain-containing protein [Chitinophagales bacterium]
MMQKVFTLLLGLCIGSSLLFAQQKTISTNTPKGLTDVLQGSFALDPSYTSIRHQQLMTYKNLGIETETQADSLYAILHPNAHPAPAQTRPTCNLNKQVYGWHPYWISTAAYNNYDYSLLSTFCYFSYELVPSSGSYSSIHSWKTTNSITLAQAAGSRVDLCVTNFGSTNNTTFLGNTAAWATFVDSIKSLLDYRNADGINIDFEGMGSSHRTAFTNFMQYTCNRLHTERPGTSVSIAMYAVDWSSTFDIAALNSYVDAFIIMGYDYHYSGGNPGPVAPLHHGSQWASYPYSYNRTANYYVNQGMSKSKLLIGVPYYGINWPSSSGSPGASSTGTGSAQLYNYIKNNLLNTYTNNWDASSMTPYFAYQSSGVWRQCWWDNEQSLQEKYDMIRDKQLGGIGIWALGYDDGYTQLWDLISNNFTDCGTPVCSDSVYDTGGPTGNYLANEDYSMTFTNPDALGSVRLTFNSFNLENNYDYLYIHDGSSTTAPLIATLTGTTLPPTITSNGNSITIRFDSDGATQAAGFDISWQCVAPACTPSTTVLPLNNWYTTNFTANFADTTCSSTAEYRFYQALDYNNEWRGNGAAGFFNDEFSTAIHSDWTNLSGTWSISSGKLQQTDEAASNTNLYASVAQDSSKIYLYSWSAMMNGTGTNKRSGLHFFSSNATLANRGNGYLIWWRIDQSRLEFYKITNDVLSVVKTTTVTILPDVWYNYQVIYNPQTGLISVYRDGTFIDSWTDTAPLKQGNAISLRNGNCLTQFDDVQVWQTRSTATANITVGSANAAIRYQSNANSMAARVRSILKTTNNYWTAISSADTRIDWTAPNSMTVNDGTTTDIDQTTTTNTISGNWTNSSDTHSGITAYSYAVGTTAGNTNLVNWTNVGTATTFTNNSINLSYNQTYYISVRATNGAGLTTTSSSDGLMVLQPCTVPANVATSNIATTTATITWSTVTPATSYTLQYRPIGGTWTTFTTATTTANLTGLTPATTYEVQVAATCPSGTSTYTTASNFTTLAVCTVPTNTAASNIATTTATITWSVVAPASSYTVQYRPTGGTWTSLTTTTTTANLTGLTPAITYEVQVAATCPSGTSTYTTTISFTTLSSCNIPTAITFTNITANSATANWTAVSGATSYSLRYRPSTSSTWTVATVSTNSTILSGLTANTTYNFQVASTCSSGNSTYSTTNSFTTLATCNTPTNLNVTLITNTSARLNWTAVSGATSYTIQGHKVGSATWSTLTATTNYKQLGNVLNVCKSYEWKVLANCASGSSAYSPLNTFTTTGCGMAGKDMDEIEWNESPLLLQPNPAKDMVQLFFASSDINNAQLSLYDLSGKLVEQHNFVTVIGENQYNWSLSHLPSGYYLVQLNTPNTQSIQRLIIE